MLEFREEDGIARGGLESKLPPQLVDRRRGIACNAEQRVEWVGIDHFEDRLPRGDKDFRGPTRVRPAAAMDAAIGRQEFEHFFLDDLQGPGGRGGVGVEIVIVGLQNRADAPILANQREAVMNGGGKHGKRELLRWHGGPSILSIDSSESRRRRNPPYGYKL